MKDARRHRNERNENKRAYLQRSKPAQILTFCHAAMLRHRFGARENRLIVTPDAPRGEPAQQTFSVPG